MVAQALGRFFTAGASLATSVMVARVMGVDAYGRLAYVLVILAVAVGIAEFGSNSVLARELARVADAETYWGTFLTVRLAAAGLVAIAALPLAYVADRQQWMIVAIGLAGLPFLASRCFEPVFQAYQRPWFSALASGVYALAVLFGIGTVLAAGGGVAWIVAVYVAANGVYTLTALHLSGRVLTPRWRPSRADLRRLLVSSAPLALSSLISVVNSRGDVFVLSRLGSEHDVGIYSAAYRVLEVAGLVAIVLMNPSIQIFTLQATRHPDHLRLLFRKVLVSLGAVAVPAAIVAPHLTSFVVTTVFGRAFAPSASVLDVLAWVAALVFFFLLAFSLCVAIDAVRPGTVIVALAAALNLGLNVIWVPRFGYMGTAWARLASDTAQTVAALLYVQHRLGNVIDGKAWTKIFSLSALLWAVTAPLGRLLGPAGWALACALYAAGLFALRVWSPAPPSTES